MSFRNSSFALKWFLPAKGGEGVGGGEKERDGERGKEGWREEGDRDTEREWEGERRDRKDSVFLLNKFFLLNFSSLKPILLFKGKHRTAWQVKFMQVQRFSGKKAEVKEAEKFKFCFDSPQNLKFLFS